MVNHGPHPVVEQIVRPSTRPTGDLLRRLEASNTHALGWDHAFVLPVTAEQAHHAR